MPLYTFHYCKPDGDSTSFEAFELPSDAEAAARALLTLEQHKSCAYVVVWHDERQVLTRHRQRGEVSCSEA